MWACAGMARGSIFIGILPDCCIVDFNLYKVGIGRPKYIGRSRNFADLGSRTARFGRIHGQAQLSIQSTTRKGRAGHRCQGSACPDLEREDRVTRNIRRKEKLSGFVNGD